MTTQATFIPLFIKITRDQDSVIAGDPHIGQVRIPTLSETTLELVVIQDGEIVRYTMKVVGSIEMRIPQTLLEDDLAHLREIRRQINTLLDE